MIPSDASTESKAIQYRLERIETAGGTGYFACRPPAELSLNFLWDYLKTHPLDEFAHRHLLRIGMRFPKARIETLIASESDPAIQALLYELVLLNPRLAALKDRFAPDAPQTLSQQTPLIYIRSHGLPDQALHGQWIRTFAQNILAHQPLPPPDAVDGPWPVADSALPPGDWVDISQIAGEALAPLALPSIEETAALALERLSAMDAVAGEEMRHVASLAPCALLRNWQVDIGVENGRHRYRLSGEQTVYGRGLDWESARVSYAMEMVERVCAYADIGPDGILGRERRYPLRHGGYAQLRDQGILALDPNRLCLEVPYENAPLYWMEGEKAGETEPIWVPAQCAFLFANLDEINLFSALGSSGLAGGTTPEGARLRALLEILERDTDATTPHDPGRCFAIETEDPAIGRLLSDYEKKGIAVQFEDITPQMGVPCYRAFVVGPQGQIVKGCAADLSGKRAVISALTETPYPYPYGPPSRRPPQNLPVRKLAKLPDYSAAHPKADLARLEKLLQANGFEAIYLDLSRADLKFPVVRAIVPGMELLGDFDACSRVHPRLFANYLALFGKA